MRYDVAVIGGGVAGMSVAAFLAPDRHVVVLEAESMLGYHASGRSAALYTECYGPGIVPVLTKASRPFLEDRPEPLLTPRGALFVGNEDQQGSIARLHDEFQNTVPDLAVLDTERVLDAVPALDPGTAWTGIFEPRAMDIDIHGLEAAYRSMVRAGEGQIRLNARVTGIHRQAGASRWLLETRAGEVSADVIVDAAGAWGDVVATMAGIPALGLTPLRRSAFLTSGVEGSSGWPMVIDADERWYLKPEGPNLLGSAADQVPSDPTDARPEEAEVAIAIERINAATTLGIRSVSGTWAGLRTFTSDRLPAVGFEPLDDSFLWIVGQGGYGIKTSPAIGSLAASLIVSGSSPEALAGRGVAAEALSPKRFR